MTKDAKIVIIVFILSLIIIVGGFLCFESYIHTKKEDEIMLYNTIVISGQEFSTSDIKNVKYSNGYSTQVKIEFKDGTIAYADCYILKDN